MDTVHHPLSSLAKLFCFGVVWVCALVVLAPVLALVGMLLALAGMLLSALFPLIVVGLLVWMIRYLLFESQPATRPLLRNCAHGTVPGCRFLAAGCCRSAAWLLEQYGVLVRRMRGWGSILFAKLKNLSWRVGGVACETACGGVLLGSLAGLTKGNIPGRLQGEYIGFAILGGLAIGLMVGMANYLPARNWQEE